MKKTAGIAIAAAALAFVTVSGFTQNTSSAEPAKESAKVASPGNFIDKDNNGVCDNFEARNGRGRGAGFVDKDGDGICDHRQNADLGKGNRSGPGKGMGYGYHHSWGKGYCGGQGYRHRHGWKSQDVSPAKDQPSGNKKD